MGGVYFTNILLNNYYRMINYSYCMNMYDCMVIN